LLYLFGDHRERREQLHEYLDNHLGHSDCGRDLGINVEAMEEVFYRLEQIGQYIVAVNDALDRLMCLGVTEYAVRNRRKAHTASRTARPVCTAVTGGRFYRVRSGTSKPS